MPRKRILEPTPTQIEVSEKLKKLWDRYIPPEKAEALKRHAEKLKPLAEHSGVRAAFDALVMLEQPDATALSGVASKRGPGAAPKFTSAQIDAVVQSLLDKKQAGQCWNSIAGVTRCAAEVLKLPDAADPKARHRALEKALKNRSGLFDQLLRRGSLRSDS